MPADPDLLQRLRGALGKGPPLRLAVLFGSRARGGERPDSDVDVGIVPLDPGVPLQAELNLQRQLSEAAQLEVDLVRLDGEDLLLAREAAVHGVAIYESQAGAFARFRANAVSAWLDFETSLAPARARWLSRVAQQGVR